MGTIPQKELRNQIGEVLRRAEAGETLSRGRPARPLRARPGEADHWIGRARRLGPEGGPQGDADAWKLVQLTQT